MKGYWMIMHVTGLTKFHTHHHPSLPPLATPFPLDFLHEWPVTQLRDTCSPSSHRSGHDSESRTQKCYQQHRTWHIHYLPIYHCREWGVPTRSAQQHQGRWCGQQPPLQCFPIVIIWFACAAQEVHRVWIAQVPINCFEDVPLCEKDIGFSVGWVHAVKEVRDGWCDNFSNFGSNGETRNAHELKFSEGDDACWQEPFDNVHAEEHSLMK